MKRPGVNFIKVLRAAFVRADPKSVKRYWQLNWIFTLLGSAHVKAALRMLMKLTPGRGRKCEIWTIYVSAFLSFVIPSDCKSANPYLKNLHNLSGLPKPFHYLLGVSQADFQGFK